MIGMPRFMLPGALVIRPRIRDPFVRVDTHFVVITSASPLFHAIAIRIGLARPLVHHTFTLLPLSPAFALSGSRKKVCCAKLKHSHSSPKTTREHPDTPVQHDCIPIPTIPSC